MSAGSLTIDLAANVAQLRTDFAQAAQLSKSTAEQIQGHWESVAHVFEAIGVAELASRFNELLQSTIELDAHMGSLAASAGVTVEQFSALNVNAQLSHTGIEDLGLGMDKLAKSIAGTANAGAPGSRALAALGISAKDAEGNLKSSSDVMVEAANKLAVYADGAGKTALMQDLFGKSGAALIPLMKNIAEAGVQEAQVTESLAAASEHYEQAVAKLTASKTALYNIVASQLLPVMTDFAKVMLDATNGANGLKAGAQNLAADHSMIDWAQSAALNVARVYDVVKDTISLLAQVPKSLAVMANDVTTGAHILQLKMDKGPGSQFNGGAIKKLQDQWAAFTKEANADMEKNLIPSDFAAKLQAQFDNSNVIRDHNAGRSGVDPSQVGKDALNYSNAKNTGGKGFAAQLSAELDAFQKQIVEEQGLLQSRNKAFDDLYKQDLISFQTVYTLKEAAAQTAYDKESAILDKEEALVRARTAGNTNPVIKAQGEKDLTNIGAERVKLSKQRADAGVADWQAQQVALLAYTNQVSTLNDQLRRNLGDSVTGAADSFDIAHKKVLDQARNSGDTDTVQKIADLKALTVEQAALNDLNQKAGLIEQQEQNLETQINRQVTDGQISQLAGMQQISAARMAEIAALKDISAQQTALAAATGNPQLIQNAANFTAKLQEQAATADLVGQKFNSLAESGLAQFFVNLTDHTKKAKDDFKTMVDYFIQQIERMAAQNLATMLIGGPAGSNGSAGGAAGLLSGLLGKVFPSLSPNSGSGLTAAGISTQAGDELALQGLGNATTGFAAGGEPPVGVPSLVGEKGPELFVPHSAGTVIPNDMLKASGGGDVHVYQTNNVDSRSDRGQILSMMQESARQTEAHIFQSLRKGGAWTQQAKRAVGNS